MGCSCCGGGSRSFTSFEPRHNFSEFSHNRNNISSIFDGRNFDCDCRRRVEIETLCCDRSSHIPFQGIMPPLPRELACCDIIKKGERNDNFLNGLIGINSMYGSIPYSYNYNNFYSIFS